MSSPCLNDAQIAEIRGAAPGRAPEALARHLASCEACQARALFGEPRPARPARRADPPTLRRAVLLAALALAAVLAFFWTLGKLAGEIR